MVDHHAYPPLSVCPRPSRRLAAFLLTLHAATLLVAAALPVPWYLHLTLFTVVSASLAYTTATYIRPAAPWAIREVVWRPDGSWLVKRVDGRRHEARLAPSSLVAVHLIVLDLRFGHLRHCHLPLFADSLDPDQARRLRVRLRQSAGRTAPNRAGDFR